MIRILKKTYHSSNNMIRILKKTYHSSTFDLNETSGQVEESTLTPLSPSAAFNLEPIEEDASYDKDSENPIVFYIDEYGYLVTESNVRAVAAKLQYSGTFMEIPTLTITVNSPALINWEIGDYIVWDYDGQTYTLREIPPVKKQARANTYGEAFVYDNMQFVSVLSDLKNLEFLDVVLESSPSHFSTLPIFSFYGDCYDLIDRINANLGRLYANWEVLAADVSSGDIYDALNIEKDVNISSPVNLFDAMGLFYSMWGLGFVYSYNETTSKHNLTIGATGGETGNFEYGQGSGLKMISKSVAKEDSVVTRLRAYGSTRNMPSRYYNNKVILIDRLLFTDPLVYLPNLMIPYWKWDVTNGDPKDAYIDCDNPDVDDYDTSFEKYGIREASIFFDGTNGLPEIYPTIERVTAKEVRDAIAALQYESAEYPLYHSPSAAIYPDTERLDLVKVGDTLDDSGIVITTDIYKETVSFAGGTANYPTTTEQFTIQLDPMYSQTLTKDGDYKATLGSQTIGLSGVDTDILSARLKMWLTLNGNKSVLLKTIDGEISMGATTFTLPDFTFSAQEQGDTYAIEISIDITTTAIIEEGIANVNCAISSGSLTYELVKSTPIRNFSITLKQIGFDIKRFLPNAGQSPVISMRSGACQGREFIIKDTTYNSATDEWTLLCSRQADTSIGNQWFPNLNFHISAGDSFVILNTSMPEFLINVAEERLYTAACDWLRRHKDPSLVYEPSIDSVYMAYNSQLIKEGMMMPLSDTDLSISGSKLINSVTITENEGAIRTFSVVLRDEADKDLLKYINEAAKNESNSAVGGITNAKTSKTESAEQPSGSTATSSSTPIEHNNLEGLQGGQASQYWHLTQAQASYLEKLRTYLKFTEEDTALYSTIDFYSEDGVSAYGIGESGGGGGGGYDMITDWSQYATGKETNVVSAQLLYADHQALANKADTDHNHDTLYLKLSGGTLTGTLSGTNATFSSYINALGYALGAYAPYGYRFYQNDSSFAFGMYGGNGIYKLQAAYQGTNSYTDFTRGFRVFNTTDNYEEFYTGKGRLELTRAMNSSSEFYSFDNGIKLDKAVLSFYQLSSTNGYARVLDIGAFGRTDSGYYGNNAESIIRFLYNTTGAYSGGAEAARFWRGTLQLGFTGTDYLAYKLAVSGDAYISGGTIIGGNFYGYGIGSFSGMVLGASFKSGNWKIIPVSTTQLQIQYNDVMMAKLDSAGNILATGGVTAYSV